MTEPPEPFTEPDAAELGKRFAAAVGGKEWQVEAEADVQPEIEVALPIPPQPFEKRKRRDAEEFNDPPPELSRLVEAMLFVGGEPLTAAQAAQVVRGLNAKRLESTVAELNSQYRRQNRPYEVRVSEKGYLLRLRPRYRAVRDRLHGSPREARLTQSALDVLSLIAYRQPILRTEIDALRGADSAGIVRTLVRLGLVAMLQRNETGGRDVYYGTTARFLDLFGLRSLDDLPRLGDAEPI